MKKATFITLLIIFPFLSKGQILTEDFESGTFPPTGWLLLQDSVDPDDDEEIIWYQQDDFETAYGSYGWAHTGDYSAGSTFGYSDEYSSYLITPQFTPTNANHVLHFFFKQAYAEEYDGAFKIKVSVNSQNTLSDFTLLEEISEADAPLNFEEHTVDLSGYIGQAIYIAFINYDDDGDGDEWYIDDITMEPIDVPGPTLNPTPADNATDVTITNTQTSRIDLSWDAPNTGGTVAQYDLWMGSQPDDLKILGHPADMTAHPKTFHFNTTYYWKAAAVNMSGESSNIWQFTTCDFPTVTAPYYVDFENGGYVPDGMDQSVDNGRKFWQFSNDPTSIAHFGNAGNTNGTQSESGGYFVYIRDIQTPSPNGTVMYSPYVDISSLNTPALSIYIISDNEGSLNVNFNIYAKNGANWVNVFTNNSNTNGWEKKVVDLSSFNLPDVTQFKFEVTEPSGSDNHDDFAFDDFRVDELTVLSTSEISYQDIKIYPNPVVDKIFVNTKDNKPVSKIELYNLNGQVLIQKFDTSSIDVSNLPKGSYLLKIYDENNHSMIKQILKK